MSVLHRANVTIVLAKDTLKGTIRLSRSTLDCGIYFSPLVKTIKLPHTESNKHQRYEYTDYYSDDPPWLFQNVLVESSAHALRLRKRSF